MQEKDLFLPIKNYFGQYGYVCDGEVGGIAKTTTIFYNNYYGWFYNEKKGTYGVTETGLVALKEYRDTIEKLKEKNSEICVKNEDTDKVRKMKSENKK